jgi:hypothetical protein
MEGRGGVEAQGVAGQKNTWVVQRKFTALEFHLFSVSDFWSAPVTEPLTIEDEFLLLTTWRKSETCTAASAN